MYSGVREHSQPKIGDACSNVLFRQAQLADGAFDGDFRKRVALISSTASFFSNAALAFRERRSGDSGAQMNATVSCGRRVLVFFPGAQ
jgi:hypothetical protein